MQIFVDVKIFIISYLSANETTVCIWRAFWKNKEGNETERKDER
jgi:hypothetical protein